MTNAEQRCTIEYEYKIESMWIIHVKSMKMEFGLVNAQNDLKQLDQNPVA